MLSAPLLEQLYIWYHAISTAYSFNQLLSLFFLYSMMGWILETTYRSLSHKRFYNPGFLKGPIIPLYGNAGIFITLTAVFTRNEPVLVRLLVYFTAITVMEFITGEIMLRLFKRRYWDYTGNLLNLRGHICLPFSVAWAILSLVFEVTLHPVSMMLIGNIDDQLLMLANGAGILILQLDFFYSIGIWRRVSGCLFLKKRDLSGKRFITLVTIQQLLKTPPEVRRRLAHVRQYGQHLTRYRKKR